MSQQFNILTYSLGGSAIPLGFFRDWRDQEPESGTFYIGKCSDFGVGSMVKYDSECQSLRVGRFVSGGSRLQFLLNGQHESRTISTYMFCIAGFGLMADSVDLDTR